MIPTTTTPRTPSVMESTQNSKNDRTSERRRRMIGISSAPCTPTGFRHNVDTAYKPSVPIPLVRLSSFGSDALSCCTPDYQDFGVESTMNNSIRSVNLYDLIDEEFVVNCGASIGSRSCFEERTKRRNSDSGERTSKPVHRRRKSILDMIDRIGTTSEDSNENDSSAMTMRSYPRGVYVVPPKEREAALIGNTVAYVSAEAYNQW